MEAPVDGGMGEEDAVVAKKPSVQHVTIDHCVLETYDRNHLPVASERYLRVDRENGENLIPYEEAFEMIRNPKRVARWLRNCGVEFDVVIAGIEYKREDIPGL